MCWGTNSVLIQRDQLYVSEPRVERSYHGTTAADEVNALDGQSSHRGGQRADGESETAEMFGVSQISISTDFCYDNRWTSNVTILRK